MGRHEYAQLPRSENASAEELAFEPRRRKWGLAKVFAYTGVACVLLFMLMGTCWMLFPPADEQSPATSSHAAATCQDPPVRREWRTLSTEEQGSYIDAVLCLNDKPSRFRDSNNGSLYDDFEWVHIKVGYSKTENPHDKPEFLAWHRYFIYVFEQTLRSECGYQGALPYWDWTLDWENIPAAPVFAASAFGGNGDPAAPRTHDFGSCVVDGPFAGIERLFYRDSYRPHCLSRGLFYHDDEKWRQKLHDTLRPPVIDEVLASATFGDFFDRLEHGAHNTIPRVINGDFYSFSAPNDPLFYLHHSQLDRLWTSWQRGNASRLADLRDVDLARTTSMHDLTPDPAFRDIMNTEAGLLCYTFDHFW